MGATTRASLALGPTDNRSGPVACLAEIINDSHDQLAGAAVLREFPPPSALAAGARSVSPAMAATSLCLVLPEAAPSDAPLSVFSDREMSEDWSRSS